MLVLISMPRLVRVLPPGTIGNLRGSHLRAAERAGVILWSFVKVELVKIGPTDRTRVRPSQLADWRRHRAPSSSSIRREQEADNRGAMAIGRSLDANRGGIAYEETLPGTRLALNWPGVAWTRGLIWSGAPPGVSRPAPAGVSGPSRSWSAVGEGAALRIAAELADPLGAARSRAA